MLVGVGSVASAALVAWLPLPMWLRFVAVVAIGLYGLWLTRWWAHRRHPGSIIGLDLSLDHRIVLVHKSGRTIHGAVLPDSYVGPLLTTIVLRPDGSRWSRSLAILPDMLPRDDFRRLRVMLRYKQPSREP